MQTRVTTIAFSASCASIAALVALAGCSGSGMDRRIADLTREQSLRLRQELDGPTVPVVASGRAPGEAREKSPTSVNPRADELNFTAAAEDRDVAARLRRLLGQVNVDRQLLGDPERMAAEMMASTEGVEVQTITLEQAWQISQRTGREYLTAQEDYLLSAISLLQERHLWGPRLFNDTTVQLSDTLDNGDTDPALNVINTLRATQRLPSGGQLEARWLINATDYLRDQSSNEYRQSSELVLAGNIPLLRGAGSIAREDLIQAERDLVYQSRTFERFRRSYLVDIATDYFSLLQTRASIANQLRQLQSLRQFNQATQARVDAGRLQAFQTAITQNQVANAEVSLSELVEQYVLTLDRFKVRLGLPIDARLDIATDLPVLKEPDADPDEAAKIALQYRLDLQNSSDRLLDSRRGIDVAKDGLLPDLAVSGEVGVPTDPDNNSAGLNLSGDDTRYRIGATLSAPLDREQERLAVRTAQIRYERAQRDHSRLQDETVLSARRSARAVDRARFQLRIAEQQVDINRRRLRAQKLNEAEVQPQEIVDTENELLRAENARDAAQTALRTAILQYLLETDQLRVARDGTLQRLPGM
ncbi:MAG: TolC family protein [Phycisphaerae bacterium]|jgi:outer membrane protein TolC